MKSLFTFALLLSALASCYPKVCDKAKDPTGCQCPSGACGDYPSPQPPPPARTSLTEAGAR